MIVLHVPVVALAALALLALAKIQTITVINVLQGLLLQKDLMSVLLVVPKNGLQLDLRAVHLV